MSNKDAVSVIVGGMKDAKEPTAQEEAEMKAAAKESAASSMIRAIKEGKATELARAFGDLMEICQEEYEDKEESDDSEE